MATLPYPEVGVHVQDAIAEVRKVIGGERRTSNATRLMNLGLCAFAAYDDEPEAFGAAGDPKGFDPVFWFGVIQFAVNLLKSLRKKDQAEGFGAGIDDGDLAAQGEALLAMAA